MIDANFSLPSPCCWVQASSPGGLRDTALQGPFIHHLLDRLRGPDRSPAWVEEVCSVLAAMPWSSECSGTTAQQVPAPVQALCEELWGVRGSLLTEECVLSALLRPRSDALVGAYSATALRLQRDHLLRDTPGLPGGGGAARLGAGLAGGGGGAVRERGPGSRTMMRF